MFQLPSRKNNESSNFDCLSRYDDKQNNYVLTAQLSRYNQQTNDKNDEIQGPSQEIYTKNWRLDIER